VQFSDISGWERLKDEFKPTKTLTDKNLLIAMMYQLWELFDEIFARWGENNEITLPAKHTLRTVAAEHLYSVLSSLSMSSLSMPLV